MIRKRLGHRRGDEMPSYALSASSLRGTTTATTAEEALIQDDDDDDAKARVNWEEWYPNYLTDEVSGK
jgi:hypothetical protein